VRIRKSTGGLGDPDTQWLAEAGPTRKRRCGPRARRSGGRSRPARNFAAVLSPGASGPAFASAPFPQPAANRDAALQASKGGIALLVTASLSFVVTGVWFHREYYHPGRRAATRRCLTRGNPRPNRILESMAGQHGSSALFKNILSAALGVVVLIGSQDDEARKITSWCSRPSILAMIPCYWPCCHPGIALWHLGRW